MNDQTDMNKGFLKDKLGNYQVDPPEKVWNEITGQIGGRRNRRGMYILLLASAASIALALTLGIHYFGPDLPQEESVTSELREEDPAGQSETSRLEQKVVETLATLPDDSTVHSDRQIPMENAELQRDPDLQLALQTETRREEATEIPAEADVAAETETPIEQETPVELEMPLELETSSEEPSLTETDKDPSLELLSDSVPELQQDPFPLMEQDRRRDPRWMLGAALSPLYSFRDAEAGAIPDNPAETGMLSYSTGVYVSYRRNSRLAFETGIYYNRTGIAIGAPGIQVFNQRYDAMLFGAGSEQAEIKTISNSVGNIVAYSGDIYMNGYKLNAENSISADASDILTPLQTSESGIQQHLDYLEIPFNLRYSLIDRTFELQLVGGMSGNFLVSNYVTVETSSGKEEIGYLSNVNTVNYSGNAGLGMIYHMSRKLSLIVEPRFRYFLNSVNDSSLPSTRPYSLGLYTGISYTF